MKGTHQTKQRTVKGHIIQITNRTWHANHIGYHVRVDGGKRYHLNVLTWDEAFNIAEERLMKDIKKDERLQAVENAAKSREVHTYQVECGNCSTMTNITTDWRQGPYATARCPHCGLTVGKHQPASVDREPQCTVRCIDCGKAYDKAPQPTCGCCPECVAKNTAEAEDILHPQIYYKVNETADAYEVHISLDEEAVRLNDALDCTFPKSGGFTSHLLSVSIDHLKAHGAIEIKQSA